MTQTYSSSSLKTDTAVSSVEDSSTEGNKPVQTQIKTNVSEGASKVTVSKTGKHKRKRKSSGAFKTISEVAEDLDVQQHVLRFWETKFTQVKPLKRGGGRRYYRPEDVEVLKTIHNLLYTEGYTIKGVQKLLKGQGRNQIIAGNLNGGVPATQDQDNVNASSAQSTASPQNAGIDAAEGKLSGKQKAILEAMLGELKELRDMFKS